MKKFFKYVPVALGLMAMASCSNDEFASESPAAQQSVKQGDLVVENEVLEMDGEGSTTRSYLSRDLKVRMYTTDDEIKAFDDELNKYDIYAFSWNDPSAQTDGVFRRFNTSSNLDAEPKWALYPSIDGQEGHWEYNKSTNNTKVWLESELAATYTPDGTYQKSDTKFENPLFKDVLPRWGQVTATEGGSALKTSLKYLTGVLRLQLNGAPDYADNIEVKVKDGDKYLRLWGDFTTTLAINDVMQTAEFAADDLATPGSDDVITVIIPNSIDLKGIDAKKSVVFIPLPTTDHSVNIEVYYYKGTTLLKKETFENKTIKRAKVYGHTAALNFAETGADNASGISDAIALEDVAEDEDLVVKATQNITTTPTDNIIYIPNLKCKSITVDLSGISLDASKGLIVKYKDVEGEGKYPNLVTLVTNAMGGSGNNLHIQLDETPFQIAQENGKLFATYEIDANALTLTSSTLTATVYTEGNFTPTANVKTLNVNGCTLDAIGGKFTALTAVNVNDGATVSGAITANTPGAAVTGSGAIAGSKIVGGITAAGDIVIKEKCDATGGAINSTNGNVTISNSSAFTYGSTVTAKKAASISGKTQVDGKITCGTFSVTENAYTTDVDVNGDATINIGYEGMAVKNTLKYTANGKFNLFNGYVWKVDANGKAVGLYHGETAGFTAIGLVSNGAQFAAKNTSIWNGQQPGFANFETGGLNLTDGADVYTATQLGWQLKTPKTFNLQTDANLDNKDWAGIVIPTTAPAYDITGNGHTVSNINLVGQFEGNAMRAGFINRTEKAITVTGLTLNGVKTTIKQLDTSTSKYLEGVGGLIGKVSSTAGTATLTLVNVKLAADYFGSLSGVKNITARCIGGLIGQTNSKTTIMGCTADLTGAMLSGHYSLGGFIGQIGSGSSTQAVDIMTIPEVGDNPETKCAVIGLTQMWVSNLDTKMDNDEKQGKTGYYIGSFEKNSTITIQDAADVNPTFTVKGMANLNKAFEVYNPGSGPKMYKYSAGAQSLIGQSGFTSPVTATINGKTYTSNLSNSGSTPDNILYNVTVTEYQP